MFSNHLEGQVQEILALADVRIDGTRPWDITVHNQDFHGRVLRQGSVGLGESYMGGWWDCKELDQFFFKIFPTGIDRSAARS